MGDEFKKTVKIEVRVFSQEETADGTIDEELQTTNVVIPINIINGGGSSDYGDVNAQMLTEHLESLGIDDESDTEEDGFNDNDVVYDAEQKQYMRYDQAEGHFVEISEQDVSITDRVMTTAEDESEYKIIDGNLCVLDNIYEDLDHDSQYTHFEGRIYRLIESNPSKEIIECITTIETQKALLRSLFEKSVIHDTLREEDIHFEPPSRYKTVH